MEYCEHCKMKILTKDEGMKHLFSKSHVKTVLKEDFIEGMFIII